MQEYGLVDSDDWPELRRSLTQAAERTASLIASTREPPRPARGLGWTAAEVAAHLVVVADINCRYAGGQAEPLIDLARLAESNQAAIDEVPERRMEPLATSLCEGIDELLRLTKNRDPDEVVRWHGQPLRLRSQLGVVLGELLMHGYDVAEMTGA